MNSTYFSELLENTRNRKPLVHCITNYVTVNDVANMVLACGASPIMADDIDEVANITGICQATDINIGTLNKRTIVSMIEAGRTSNRLNHPVVLDPVGAGASVFRSETIKKLMKTVKFTVIKGNISEIKTIAQGVQTGKGVDAAAGDCVTEENLSESAAFVKDLSLHTGTVVAVTGAIDIIASADKTYVCRNGCEQMSFITGTGCMLSAVVAAFCGANPSVPLEAAAAAVSTIGICGEIAWNKTQEAGEGTGSFRTRFIDAMSSLTTGSFVGRCKLERL